MRIQVVTYLMLTIPAATAQHVTDDLKETDLIGATINVIDNVLRQITRGYARPKSRSCAVRMFKIAEFEFKLSGQPRGSCPYCCPITHPKKHVKLFFTNKDLKGNMVQLKLSKKMGLLKRAGVKNNIPTVMFIHGFTEHGLGPLSRKLRDAYLSRPEEYNIILVDWSELCSFPWYPTAAENTKLVANVISDFLVNANKTGEMPISQLHIIGFSLGAHVAGFIGKNLKPVEKVPRITALDPARPSFPIEDPTQRVSKDDAEYVDVIHTDGGKFGIYMPVGHADFYPNGGVYLQPGCTTSYLAENQSIQQFGTCSHLRAVNFYVESIKNPTAFPVFKCSDRSKFKRCKRQKAAYMGFGANKENAVGDFYLVTNERPPFGKAD